MAQDRGGDIDRGDQPALVGRLRGELAVEVCGCERPVLRARSPAAAAHSSSWPRADRARCTTSSSSARARAWRPVRAGPHSRLRPAGRSATTRRLCAAQQRRRARAAQTPGRARRRPRVRRGRRRRSRRCRRSRRSPRMPAPPGIWAASRPGRSSWGAFSARLRAACQPVDRTLAAPSVRSDIVGRRGLRVSRGGDAGSLGDVEQQLRGGVGALGRGHDPDGHAGHARQLWLAGGHEREHDGIAAQGGVGRRGARTDAQRPRSATAQSGREGDHGAALRPELGSALGPLGRDAGPPVRARTSPGGVLDGCSRSPGASAGSTVPSMFNRGSTLSNHPGMCQVRSPTRCSTAGSSRQRTTSASRNTALARLRPNSLMTRSSPSMNDRNTHTMIAAAAVTTRPVSARPSATARECSRVCVQRSCMREIRNTS